MSGLAPAVSAATAHPTLTGGTAGAGDSCSPAGALQINGGTTLICNGTIWVFATQIFNGGALKLSTATDTCAAGLAGSIRYSGGAVQFCNGSTWANIDGTGGPALSALTAATATNNINNAAYEQTWNWNSLAGANGLTLATTSTAATGNTQTLLNIAMSGANAAATQTTYGEWISNTHTGTASTNVGLYATASGGTNNYAAIFNGGNVGIGTTRPAYTLELNGDLGVNPAISFTNQAGTLISAGSNELVLQSTGGVIRTGWGGSLHVLDNSGALKVSVSGSADSYLTGGNVGIGTTTPSSPLHIATNVNDNNYSGHAMLTLENADTNAGGVGVVFKKASNPDWVLTTGHGNNGGWAGVGHDAFALMQGNNVNAWTYDATVGGMGIGPSAYVPAGTTLNVQNNTCCNPTKITIRGNSIGGYGTTQAGTNLLEFQNYNAGSPIVYTVVDAYGKIGIGTTSPLAPLNLKGTLRVDDPSAADIYGPYLFSVVDSGGWNTINQFAGRDVSIWNWKTSGGTNLIAMQLKASTDDAGNPNYLSLNDASNNPKIFFNTNGVTFLNGGPVGIGTTTPGSALDVKGTLRLSGSTSGYVGFSPAAAAGSATYVLPAADGTAGYQLTTNGSGTLSWATAGIGGPLSAITAAIATNSINNAAYEQTWNWNSLVGANGLTLATTSTAATGNTQTLLNVAMSGANATSTQTTYGEWIANTHTGTASTNIGLYATASGGTNNYAAIFNGGKVGIGTASPGAPLQVAGAGRFITGTADATYNSILYVEATGAGSNGTYSILTGRGSGVFDFAVTNAGNVGIGTTSPVTLLHIDSSNYGAIYLGDNGANGFHITKESGDNSFNIFSGPFGSGTPRFTINANADTYLVPNGGNVGMGTTTPVYSLDVYGSGIRSVNPSDGLLVAESTATNGRRFSVWSDSAGLLRIFDTGHLNGGGWGSMMTFDGNTGNVGIGTTTPAAQLHVVTAEAAPALAIILDTDTKNAADQGPYLTFRHGGQGTGYLRSASGSGNTNPYLALGVNNGDRLFIDKNGSTGIGTTSPAATLDVNGYAKLAVNSGAPATCNAAHEGSIAYTGTTTHYLCFCDGTSWKQAHSPSTACTW